jgi:hypothetical protein
MATAENIVKAYIDRKKSANWAVWAQTHKAEARMLEQAMMAENDG